MEFKAIILAKKLKHVVSVIRRVDDEAVWGFDSTGVLCRIVDAANAHLTQVKLFGAGFDSYAVDESYEIGIDLKKMASVLKRATAKELITISGDDAALHFERGIHRRAISLLDPEKLRKPPNWMNLPHTSETTLSGKEFKEIIAESEAVSKQVIVSASKEGVTFDAESNAKKPDTYRAILGADRVQMLRADSSDVRSTYTTAYLHDIAVDMKTGDEVVFRFSTDLPCEIEYTRDNVETRHMLAPRIEE